MRSDTILSGLNILGRLDNSHVIDQDRIIQDLRQTVGDTSFDPIENELISSGDVRLLQNDSLRGMLSRYYSDVKQSQQVQLDWQKMRRENYLPFLVKMGVARNLHHHT